MDTQSLQALCAVAELGSFSKAAHRLFLTQPAISKRIANLEQQLNCQLFDRIGRKIQLTEAGRILLPRARQILTSVADTQRAIDDLSGEIRGQLAIATSHHIGLHRLPPLLKQFAAKFPKVELNLRFMDSERAYEEVAQGDHDVAIVTLSPSNTAKISSETWWQDELVFTCAAEHPLANTNQPTLQQLSTHPAILPDANTYTTFLIQSLFDRAGVPLNISMTTQSLDTIKMMVSIGLGWSLLPRTLLSDDLHQIEPADATPIVRQLGCIRHAQRDTSRAAAAFQTLCRSQIQEK
ncbi:LysR family transcriptional regulator [Simiduia aestuariiviva]|uniref:DNA-binding transcriptional LysR family regulator n=1 Tax=Simiduia aestuariiviva TaxID=1510459 RepID=A0A839UNF8_9GAMM|nr:LysR family transcriptional regulator [Simiduia aestuariiviva]MBB3168079.1 DNA-binding transcriptional LysR family regulator [Simiduia aestuariiviva]